MIQKKTIRELVEALHSHRQAIHRELDIMDDYLIKVEEQRQRVAEMTTDIEYTLEDLVAELDKEGLLKPCETEEDCK